MANPDSLHLLSCFFPPSLLTRVAQLNLKKLNETPILSEWLLGSTGKRFPLNSVHSLLFSDSSKETVQGREAWPFSSIGFVCVSACICLCQSVCVFGHAKTAREQV